jgi:hypothetical protein
MKKNKGGRVKGSETERSKQNLIMATFHIFNGNLEEISLSDSAQLFDNNFPAQRMTQNVSKYNQSKLDLVECLVLN